MEFLARKKKKNKGMFVTQHMTSDAIETACLLRNSLDSFFILYTMNENQFKALITGGIF